MSNSNNSYTYCLDETNIDLIKESIGNLGMNNTLFYTECGISANTFYKMMGGEPVSIRIINKVKDYLKENGQGENVKKFNPPKRKLIEQVEDQDKDEHDSDHRHYSDNGHVSTTDEMNQSEYSDPIIFDD